MQEKYDYIIAGAGAAGLSLAMHLLQNGILNNHSLLIIDKVEKNQNDRTWCFWENKPGLFESVIYKRWKHLQTFAPDFHRKENIEPYEYKMIRGIDFYKYCIETLAKNNNIHFITAAIQSITTHHNTAIVAANGKEYAASFVFSSLLLQPPKLQAKQTYLLQHFKGLLIETAEPFFDAAVATFMDFRVAQRYGTTFVYVLPITNKKALVEYTLFSANTLEQHQYKEALEIYIKEFLSIEKYHIIEEEFGIIPMTDFRFKQNDGPIIYIGTAGGNTRASSGFTFQFIQKQAKAIVAAIQNNTLPNLKPVISSRAKFLDSVLLKVLDKNYVSGQKVFTNIFKRKKILQVLQFMDDESSLMQDAGVALTQPKAPFIKALFQKWK